ncbi:MAG: cytochrome c [Deltaproteobacteria bacterium]|nr:cytochrome c [Deltaproteobacteria bacterium]
MKARLQPVLGEMRYVVSLLTLMMVILLRVTPGTAVAQQEEVVAAGKREFHGHCAVCHGLGGKGESVMTTLNLLTVKPTDLTQLGKRHKGQFPFWQVYRIIDGREEVKGHGSRDMPIWGDVFTEQEGGTLADETRGIGRTLAIIHYIQSIQEK